MNLQEEKKMLKQAKGDKQAFNKIYDQHYLKIFNYVLKRTADLEVTKDLTSEVFLKAFTKLWQFQFRNIPFSAWLYKIAGNEIYDWLKKNSRKNISLEKLLEEHGFEPAGEETPRSELMAAEAIMEHNEEFFKVQKQIRKLPMKFQTIISLKFFEKKH